MSTPSVAGRVTFFTCAALLAGCVDGSPSEPSTSAARPHQSAVTYDEVRPAEAEFARLARDVPGAGGFFLDENGAIFVYLKDRGRAEAAKQAVLGILARTGRQNQPGRRDPAVVALAGRFDFFELNAARNRITDPVLDLDGVVYVDLDEGVNRVTVAVSNPAARARVEARVAELGVGRDIVNIELAEEITEPIDDGQMPSGSLYSPTVNGLTRPLLGGTQIGRRLSDPEKFRKCTMGFTGRLNDGTGVFITNSHCSAASWDTDGSIFHQPFPSRYDETQRVGYEYRDKRGESCGFLSPNVCRYADATAVRIDDAVEAETGYIARTRYYSEYSAPGSLEIDPVNPRFRIAGKGGFPFKGQASNKIGATTGWTRGQVSETCLDVKQPGRSYSKLRCQYATKDAGVAKGDSGSPVFFENLDGTVIVEGILWGSGNGQFWWSPFHGIEDDLGGINIFPPTSAGGGGSGNELPPPDDCTVDPSLPC